MRDRAFFKNTSTVPLFGKQPGEKFQIRVNEDGSPVDVHWRKRLLEGVIEPASSSSASASPATPPKSLKKGA